MGYGAYIRAEWLGMISSSSHDEPNPPHLGCSHRFLVRLCAPLAQTALQTRYLLVIRNPPKEIYYKLDEIPALALAFEYHCERN